MGGIVSTAPTPEPTYDWIKDRVSQKGGCAARAHSLRRCVVARFWDQHTLRGLSGCASWRAFYIRHNDEPSLGSTRPSFGVA